jgi:hypothetical protein
MFLETRKPKVKVLAGVLPVCKVVLAVSIVQGRGTLILTFQKGEKDKGVLPSILSPCMKMLLWWCLHDVIVITSQRMYFLILSLWGLTFNLSFGGDNIIQAMAVGNRDIPS